MDNVVKFNEEEHYCLIQLDAGKANAVSTQLAQELNVALDMALTVEQKCGFVPT